MTAGDGGHSVRRHLGVSIEGYDLMIRRFIPGYEEMITTAAEQVVAVDPERVLDLGAGTGALSEAVLDRLDAAERRGTVELWDIDPEMLEAARRRIRRFGDRALPVLRSFDEPLGRCDAVMASLSLHHIPTMTSKTALYGRVREALREGGVFVNADVTLPEGGPERDQAWRTWADHLVGSGIPEERAWKHFEEWSAEDTYFPLEAELGAMERVGLRTECVSRNGPSAVVVGRRV